ncbi:MAG TPA: universal stress protein [Streptosporangiaceae bacterium]|nr:universal stress protein [Streptosporangiaceae bacterium]
MSDPIVDPTADSSAAPTADPGSAPIIVGTDGSRQARTAVAWAADDAALFGRPLRIVHAVERWLYDIPRFPVRGTRDPLTEAGRELLADAEKLVRERRPDVDVTTEVREDEVGHALQNLAPEAFEIVLGNRGHGGFAALLVGSTGLRVAGHAPGPVVIVRGEVDARRGVVVAGVDLVGDSALALEYAFAAAAARGASVRVVHASRRAVLLAEGGYAPGVEELEKELTSRMEEVLAPWRARYPDVAVSTELTPNHPVAALVEASQAADLLVTGAHAGGPREIRLGSVGHGVIHHAHCPVAIVRDRA